MKPELYFEIPDNVGVMSALIQAVPAKWARQGWIDAYLSTGYGKPVTFIEAGREFLYFGISFEETRACVLSLLQEGHRGWVEFSMGCYGKALHKRPAVCNLQLGPWLGTHAPEIGHQSSRVRLSWYKFTKPDLSKKGYEATIDTEASGCYDDVAPVAEVCRRLGLREYEVIRACDYYRTTPPYAIAAE